MGSVIADSAIESWISNGLACVICPAWGSFSAYIQLPRRSVKVLISAYPADPVVYPGGRVITYGPDSAGWIGIDTNQAGDYWAPDDLMGYMSEDAIRYANAIRKRFASKSNSRRWTLVDLRQEIEKVAFAVSRRGAMPPTSE
ncbi:hypothetical protein ACGFJT_37540 [Actinomadura geliboluensis]|uniref:hypothetical protein n=1 Tax=Actinomadura geliboluensis TaxID=882440 RepID=UPI003714E6A7